MGLVGMQQNSRAKRKPTLLQTHGLPPGVLHHSVASDSVPTVNTTIKMKPHLQSEAEILPSTGKVGM